MKNRGQEGGLLMQSGFIVIVHLARDCYVHVPATYLLLAESYYRHFTLTNPPFLKVSQKTQVAILHWRTASLHLSLKHFNTEQTKAKARVLNIPSWRVNVFEDGNRQGCPSGCSVPG